MASTTALPTITDQTRDAFAAYVKGSAAAATKALAAESARQTNISQALDLWRSLGFVADVDTTREDGTTEPVPAWTGTGKAGANPVPSMRPLAVAIVGVSKWTGHESTIPSAAVTAAMVPAERAYWAKVQSAYDALRRSKDAAIKAAAPAPAPTANSAAAPAVKVSGKNLGQALDAIAAGKVPQGMTPTAAGAVKARLSGSPVDTGKIVRDAVASIANGRAVPGVRPADVKAIKADIAAMAPAATPAPVEPADVVALLQSMTRARTANPALFKAAQAYIMAVGSTMAPTATVTAIA